MHRPTIALIAIVLLAIGFYTSGQEDSAASAACLRVGTVMAILWFAQPQLKNLSGWVIAGMFVTLLVATRWPRILLLAIPVATVLWMLKPRGNRIKREG